MTTTSDETRAAEEFEPAETPGRTPFLASWSHGPVAFARQGWRRLTSMRTALVLLFLLALASVPGSLLPQRPLNPIRVDDYIAEHPGLSRILDPLGFFDVFAAPWFAAIYLLLFVSVVGCVVPRLRMHLRSVRTPPPIVPRRLERLPESASYSVAGAPAGVAAGAKRTLRGWRTVVRTEDGGVVTVAAERGYLRETGNLIFHAALVALLVGVAAGRLWGYQGTVLVTEGDPGICNAVPLYDSFRPGKLVDSGNRAPVCSDTLDDYSSTYEPDGTPSSFNADITYSIAGGPPRQYDLRVNEPLRVDGVRVYLVGHGFAPQFTVRKGGKVLATKADPYLPQGGTLLSEGATKFLDGVSPQLAVYGLFAPTGAQTPDGRLDSASPQPLFPAVAVAIYQGNLGLDGGRPQSVYAIDEQQIRNGALKEIDRVTLTRGQAATLPDGTTVTFDGYKEWATLQVNRDPGQLVVLLAAGAIVLGLLLSLAVRRRRLFLRISPGADDQAGRSVVAVGGLARTDSGNFPDEFGRLVERLRDPSRRD